MVEGKEDRKKIELPHLRKKMREEEEHLSLIEYGIKGRREEQNPLSCLDERKALFN